LHEKIFAAGVFQEELIKHSLRREHFWSRSFCLLTTGGVPIEVIKRYIESQGKET
jgi:putative transposase